MQWALSGTGQAVATWVSAAISLLAIILALFVALHEQRRANADQRREAAQERKAHEQRALDASTQKSKFVRICAQITQEAIDALEAEIRKIPKDSYVSWNKGAGVPHAILPMLDSLRSLQSVWQEDHHVVLTLSRTVRTLDDLVNGMFDIAPSSARAIGHAEPRLAALVLLRSEMESYEPATTASL